MDSANLKYQQDVDKMQCAPIKPTETTESSMTSTAEPTTLAANRSTVSKPAQPTFHTSTKQHNNVNLLSHRDARPSNRPTSVLDAPTDSTQLTTIVDHTSSVSTLRHQLSSLATKDNITIPKLKAVKPKYLLNASTQAVTQLMPKTSDLSGVEPL